MDKYPGLDSFLLVANLDEVFDFYKHIFDMEETTYHGTRQLVLSGKRFFWPREVSTEEQAEFIKLMRKYMILTIGIENFTTVDDLQKTVDLLAKEGELLEAPHPLPWTPCAAEVFDKYGVKWYLAVGTSSPIPKGCLACVPPGEVPKCDFHCIRWLESDFSCPKIN